MARIPTAEIDRLKLEVSLVRLVEAAGVALKPHGKDRIGRCPFHDDKTPSLVISPKSNLWHCLGACQAGGSVVDWVMRWEGVSFRRAVELLRKDLGIAPSLEPAGRASQGQDGIACVPDARPAEEVANDVDDQALLRQVIDYYHATLKQSPDAQAYLAKRGLTHPELVEHFQLGYANRTLGYQLPERQRVARERLQAQLERIGIYRTSGHEHLNGSLIVPVITPAGEITEVYGRKIGARLREGTPLHLYLPGPHRGVFNEQGLVGQAEVVLCEALLDALTFWCAGYRNVTASYGIEGFTDEHLAAFQRHGLKRVLIAYDADAAGDSAADKLAQRLIAAGFDCYRCRFPKGSDANQYALDVTPAAKSLGLVIRQAEWMGHGVAPKRAAVEPHAVVDVPALVAELEAAKAEIPALPPLPEPPAHRVPPAAPCEPAADVAPTGELTLTLADRVYRVRGIEKNSSYELLKVGLRATCGDFFHLDTLDLAAAKARQMWIKQASVELGISEEVAKSDLGKVLRTVEARRDALLVERLQPKADTPAAPALSPAQHDAALALLRDPRLIERIVADFERCGLVGEPVNALVGYLAAVTRKLAHPLALLVQSTSAAGKSTLMDAVLRFVPEADRVHYSAMTGQSLFYLGEQSMQHRILAIAEEEGVRQAAYALKVLQSQGSLTIASTGKDPVTGDLQTKTYTVEGPVMLFLTTTAIDVDEELTNRCLVLTIDESREQTRAILARQRQARTLAGLKADREAHAITATHRAAQQLLRPLAVVNPYADRLGFLDDRTRLRRDHQKYLTLIDALAFLQQYQRPIKQCVEDGATIEYVEVTPADIALANRLAHEVLGRSLDELPPQTRRVLGTLDALVRERMRAQAIERGAVRFTRRDVRQQAGLSDTQARIHLERLVELEHVAVHRGQRGQSFVYELVFDGDVTAEGPHLPGLIDVGTTTDLAGVEAPFAGSTRPQRGAFAVGSRGEETTLHASADAVLPSLVAVVEETAHHSEPRARRRNGTSYPSVPRN
jgi:DNA primase catalytic core